MPPKPAQPAEIESAPAPVQLAARLSEIGEALRQIAAVNDDIAGRREGLIQARERLSFVGRPKSESIAEIHSAIDQVRDLWFFREGRSNLFGTHFADPNGKDGTNVLYRLFESSVCPGTVNVRAFIAILAAPLKVAIASEIEAISDWPEAMPTSDRLAEIAGIDEKLIAIDAEQAELQRAIDASGLQFEMTPEALPPLTPIPKHSRTPKELLPGWDRSQNVKHYGPKEAGDPGVTITRTEPEADTADRMPPAPQGLMPEYRKDWD